jgi:hypothetical protein
MTVRLIPLAAVLAAAGLLSAQPATKSEPAKKDGPAAKEPAKPAPGSLEDTLDKALRNSADIKAAEAKVRDAEAELNRVRQQVLTKATALHADLNLAKRMLGVAEQSLAIQEKARQQGATGLEAILAAQTMVEKHRGEVEKLETELKSLRGEFAIKGVTSATFSPDGRALYISSSDGSVRFWDVANGTGLTPQVAPQAPASVKAPMLDRVKKLLDQEVEFAVDNVPVADALKDLLERAGSDIPLRILPASDQAVPIVLKGKLTIGAWMEAIEDSDPNIRLVVRDYGLLLTTKAGVPDGALRVQELWKENYTELKKPVAPKQ